MTTQNQLTSVINITGGKQLGQDYDVYIGRYNPMRRLPQSLFANPFVIGRDGNRDRVLLKYECYISTQLLENPELYQQLQALKGKRLGCWCKPKPCHGDILIKLLETLPCSTKDKSLTYKIAPHKNKKNIKNVENATP